jgi:TetR/AcrR family transcriptional regulator
MARRPGRPDDSNELDLRQRILDAAATEFAAAGYEGARMEGIAREAGCNKALPYFYFKTKQALFRAVLDHGAQQRAAEMHAQPSSLAQALVYWFSQNMADPIRIRLVMQEALAPAAVKGDSTARRQYLNAQVEAVRQFQHAGLLRNDVDAENLMLAILALTSFPAAFPEVAGAALDRPDPNAMSDCWSVALQQLAKALGPPVAGTST